VSLLFAPCPLRSSQCPKVVKNKEHACEKGTCQKKQGEALSDAHGINIELILRWPQRKCYQSWGYAGNLPKSLGLFFVPASSPAAQSINHTVLLLLDLYITLFCVDIILNPFFGHTYNNMATNTCQTWHAQALSRPPRPSCHSLRTKFFNPYFQPDVYCIP
jgi:hypothetical protein